MGDSRDYIGLRLDDHKDEIMLPNKARDLTLRVLMLEELLREAIALVEAHKKLFKGVDFEEWSKQVHAELEL